MIPNGDQELFLARIEIEVTMLNLPTVVQWDYLCSLVDTSHPLKLQLLQEAGHRSRTASSDSFSFPSSVMTHESFDGLFW